jgi:hypothetical protein
VTTRPRRARVDAEEAARRAEERREEARRQLEAACDELRSSEGWRRFADARGLLRGYSLNNTLLILAQRPDATVVASYRRWNELGRQVRRGERALRIWAPSLRKERDPTTGDETDVVRTWVLVPVFDISQTEGPPLPQPPAPAPLSGDSHSHLLPNLERGAAEAGYAIERREALPRGTEGYVDHRRRTIVLSAGLAPNAEAAVLVHELAHVRGARYRDFGRAGAEVVAETAAHVALLGAGLDTSGQAVPYVAGWADAAPKQMALYAEAVHRIAAALEDDLGLEQTRPREAMVDVDELAAHRGTPTERAAHGPRPRREHDLQSGANATAARTYRCRRDADGARVEVQERDGTVRALRNRARHSSAGLDWGHGGSGPADAALSILWDHLGIEPSAAMCEAFKWEIVARMRDGAELQGSEISRWRAARGLAHQRPAKGHVVER